MDDKAREKRVTMTTLVRQAVRELRLKGVTRDSAEPAFDEILRMTKGTWRKGDAAAWVKKMRRE